MNGMIQTSTIKDLEGNPVTVMIYKANGRYHISTRFTRLSKIKGYATIEGAQSFLNESAEKVLHNIITTNRNAHQLKYGR